MSPVVRTLITFSTLSLIIMFSPFGNAEAAARKAQVEELDQIIAIVNSDVITSTDLKKRIKRVLAQLKARNSRMPPKNVLYRQILEQLITERLQLQLAKRASVIIGDEAINNIIQKIASENNLTLAEFKDILARDGIKYSEYRQNIKNEITISQLKKRRIENSIVVTEQEIDTELRNQKNNKALADEFHLAHILIATPEAATPAEIQKTRQKAQQVIAQLNIGADFAETAAAYSNGPNALNGGDLGWRQAAQLPSIFTDKVIKLEKGQITGLIRGPNGFHIVKVIDRRSSENAVLLNKHMPSIS